MSDPSLFGRILVGLDETGRAAPAVRRAVSLAKALGSEVELAHAGRREYLRWITSVMAEVEAEPGAPDLRVVSLEGSPAAALLERAELIGADLIVIGPHGHRGLLDFGSAQRAVLAHAHVPVWCQDAELGPIETILVAVDFSDESRRALELAASLASALGAKLRLMHVFAPPILGYAEGSDALGPTYVVDQEREAARQRLDLWTREFSDRGIAVEPVFVEESDPAHALVEQPGVDLTILGTHGHTALSMFFLGSVAYRVLRAASPVLVVPPPGRAEARATGRPLSEKA